MTHLQVEFLGELKSLNKATVVEYAKVYNKYCSLAIENEKNNGASRNKAKVMGNYYIDAILLDFIGKQEVIDEIIDLKI